MATRLCVRPGPTIRGRSPKASSKEPSLRYNLLVTAQAQKLLEQARMLGRDELAELVDSLAKELDDRPPTLSAADVAELNARSHAIGQGEFTEYENAKAFVDSLRHRAADSLPRES